MFNILPKYKMEYSYIYIIQNVKMKENDEAMDQRSIWEKISTRWRIILVIFVLSIIVFAIAMMLLPEAGLVEQGSADLSDIDFNDNESVLLSGQWEFYWNQFLSSEDFDGGMKPQIDAFMKVPGTWNSEGVGPTAYPSHGIATYRLVLKYPATLKDPALRIKNVASAYKLYVNGQLYAEIGQLSENPLVFEEDEQNLSVELPKNTQEIELIFQVGNLNYARGGLRESPVFGSKQVLAQQSKVLVATQLLFIGCVFIFGIHYFLLFLLQKANKTALFFCVFCFITALRALMWGEVPLKIFFPDVSFIALGYINYLTGYNMIAAMLLFVLSIYPLSYKKRFLWPVLLPTLFFDVLLFLKQPVFASALTNFVYLMVLLQMVYIIGVMIKAVLGKRDNSILMFFAACIFFLAINQDILHYTALGGINMSYAFLYGNFTVVVAMSFVQARQQANTYQKLMLYNENLVEADRLKDKIMETEMSFLQAQIKPHFLYNALNAIANVCEKDGKAAGKLIIDLAIYLRGSLEFNNLDKMVTIEKELEFVDTYFHIEQARYGEKIQLRKEIDVPLEYQIPVLVLQPLVENAVRHGISKKLGGGTVFVRMKKTDDGVCIEIEDDGVGIKIEKLSALLTEGNASSGIGLINIHSRLLKTYGRGLDISSEEGRTIVKIVITEERKQL